MSFYSVYRRFSACIFIYALASFWTAFSFFMFLLAVVRRPILFFQRLKRRTTPPNCVLDKSLGQHEYVRANGIKFHYVTSGEKSNPLMLFLHGFPEV